MWWKNPSEFEPLKRCFSMRLCSLSVLHLCPVKTTHFPALLSFSTFNHTVFPLVQYRTEGLGDLERCWSDALQNWNCSESRLTHSSRKTVWVTERYSMRVRQREKETGRGLFLGCFRRPPLLSCCCSKKVGRDSLWVIHQWHHHHHHHHHQCLFCTWWNSLQDYNMFSSYFIFLGKKLNTEKRKTHLIMKKSDTEPERERERERKSEGFLLVYALYLQQCWNLRIIYISIYKQEKEFRLLSLFLTIILPLKIKTLFRHYQTGECSLHQRNRRTSSRDWRCKKHSVR